MENLQSSRDTEAHTAANLLKKIAQLDQQLQEAQEGLDEEKR